MIDEHRLKFLRSLGKCASVDQFGHVCTLSENHHPREHMAQVLGGVNDGKILFTWHW